MTDKLDYWDVRLHNWALWAFGGSVMSSSSLCITGATQYWDALTPIPSLVGDAMDTDDLVQKLAKVEFVAVKAWYSASGTKEFIARSLGIHRVTLWQRVRNAKGHLDDYQWQARRNLLRHELRGALGAPACVPATKGA